MRRLDKETDKHQTANSGKLVPDIISRKEPAVFFLTKALTRTLKTKAHTSLLPPAGVEIDCRSLPKSELQR